MTSNRPTKISPFIVAGLFATAVCFAILAVAIPKELGNQVQYYIFVVSSIVFFLVGSFYLYRFVIESRSEKVEELITV